jgi:hypothetical protein
MCGARAVAADARPAASPTLASSGPAGATLVHIAEEVLRSAGVGVVVAENPAADEGVLGQGTGGLQVAKVGQPDGEVAGRDQGGGMVVAEDTAAGGSKFRKVAGRRASRVPG